MKSESLSGKRVIVTGGSEGIGRAIVGLLVREGARVVLRARDESKLAKAAEEMSGGNEKIHAVRADISKSEDVARLFAEADDILDGVDILVANAAIGGEGVTDMSDDEDQEIIDINLKGHIPCARRAVTRMEGKNGHIIFIGSLSGDVREAESAVYAARKVGIQGLAGAFRKQANETGVHVTLIEPGAVATPMHGLAPKEEAERIAEEVMMRPEDIAQCVALALTRPSRCDIVALQVRPHRQII